MPRNSSGVYSLPSGNPVVTRTTILSTWANNTMPDIGAELTNSIAKGGQTTPIANLPMGGFRHTNVADALALNEYSAAGQVQSGVIQRCTGEARAAGDAYTAQLPFGSTTFINGQMIILKFPATNTGTTPTLSINGAPVYPILREDASSIVVGDCRANVPSRLMWNNTSWLLLGAVVSATSIAGVSSFNTRTGAVVLTSADVVTALTYTPVNKAGDTMTGKLTLSGDATNNLHAVTLQQLLAQIAAIPGASGVSTWNGRSGAVTMTGTDVVNALTYTPANINNPTFTTAVNSPKFIAGDGSAAVPTYTFTGQQNAGVYRDVTYVGGTAFSHAGVFKCAIGGFLGMVPTFNFVWFNPGLTGAEAGIARNAAGVVEINSGVLGTFADLKLRSLFASDGSKAAPSHTFVNEGNTGFFRDGAGYISYVSGGAYSLIIGPVDVSLPMSNRLTWAYDAAFTGIDVGLGRLSAGSLGINDGITPTNYRDLRARFVTAAGFTPAVGTATLGGASGIDYNNGQTYAITISSALTFSSIVNVPVGAIMRLLLMNTNFGVSFPANVYWPAGGMPSLTAGPLKAAIVVLMGSPGGNCLANASAF